MKIVTLTHHLNHITVNHATSEQSQAHPASTVLYSLKGGATQSIMQIKKLGCQATSGGA